MYTKAKWTYTSREGSTKRSFIFFCLFFCLVSLTIFEKYKANELIKNLHALKSPSTLMIKKRQVMFNVFGDYRTKMKQDESKKTKQRNLFHHETNKKYNSQFFYLISETKISFTNSNKTDPTDGKCLKKKTDSIVVPLIAEKSTTPFKFEFKIPE